MLRKKLINHFLAGVLAVILALPANPVLAELNDNEVQEEVEEAEEFDVYEDVEAVDMNSDNGDLTKEESESDNADLTTGDPEPEKGNLTTEDPESGQVVLQSAKAAPLLGAGNETGPDYTISKTGYTGFSVSNSGFENYGTIGVFIPRRMAGQEIEYGAGGGLDWITDSVTYYDSDSKTAQPVTEAVRAALIYTGEVSAGVTALNGSAYLILKNRAYDVYGNTYDVRVDFSGFELGQVVGREAGDGGVLISELYPGGAMNVCSFALKPAVKTAGDSVSGVAVDLDITVLDENGDPLHEPTIFYMEDVDASDHVALADARKYGTVYIGGRYDEAGNPTSFIESVYLRSAVGTVYTTDSCVLNYDLEPGRFIGTELTGNSYAHSQKDSGLLYETTTDDIKISWTGSQCATALFTAARSYTVTSQVVGAYPEGGTITNGGCGAIAVPYRMDYGLQIQAAPGYVPENIWVDGELIDSSDVISGREGFYLFKTVDADHTIDVSFTPIRMNVTLTKVSEETGQNLSGAEFMLYEWNGAEYAAISDGGEGALTLAENELGIYSGTVIYSAANEGKFRIVETKAPNGYMAGYEVLFEIDPEGAGVQSFEDRAVNARHLISITIKKTVPAADLYTDHGSADFVFRVDGIDFDGNEKTYYRLISMDANEAEGFESITKEAEVLQIPEGSYTVTELKTSRFVLTGIEAGEGGFTAVAEDVRQTASGTSVVDGFAGGYLTADRNEVMFTNQKETWDEFSHSSSVVNHIGTSETGR